MILVFVLSLLLLKRANGQSLSVSMIPHTGSYPIQGDSLTLNCYQSSDCIFPLQWYYWNTSNLENAIWTAGTNTSLAWTKGIHGYCYNLKSNCSLTMVADKVQHDGPWYCLCLGMNASIVVDVHGTGTGTNQSLTVGEIIGIVFGCVAITAIAIGATVLIKKHKDSTYIEFVSTIKPGKEIGVEVKVKCVGPNETKMTAGNVKVSWPDGKQSEAVVLQESGPDGTKPRIVVVEGTCSDGKKGTAVVVIPHSASAQESERIGAPTPTNGSKLVVIGAQSDNTKKVNALVVSVKWLKGAKGDAVVIKVNE